MKRKTAGLAIVLSLALSFMIIVTACSSTTPEGNVPDTVIPSGEAQGASEDNNQESPIQSESVLATAERGTISGYGDQVLETTTQRADSLLSSSQIEDLKKLNFDVETEATIEKIEDSQTGDVYTRISTGGHKDICLDKNNEIFSLSNFTEEWEEPDRENYKSFSEYREMYDEMAPILMRLLNLDSAYILEVFRESGIDDTGDFIDVTYTKQYENGLLNIYESVNIGLMKAVDGLELVVFHKFDDAPNTAVAVIDENEALEKAQDLLSEPNSEVKSVRLTFTKPNFMFAEGGPYKSSNSVRLTYEIQTENGTLIRVDAVTGEITGGDIYG